MSLSFLSTPGTTTTTSTRGRTEKCCRRLCRRHQRQRRGEFCRVVALSLEEEEEEKSSTTVESVLKILREESRSHPTFFPRERISSSSSSSSSSGEEGDEEEVRFTSDVFSFRGSREEFSKLQSRWERRLSVDLKDVEMDIDACSSVDRNVFLVRWNVTFVPAKLAWLQNLAQNWPFGEVDVERRDILHKMGETTRFTYKALFQTLKRMATDKKLTMPVAKIEGQTKLTFNSAKLTSIEESLSLVDSINSNRVRNKRICRDLLEFLDTRKPIGVDYKEYDLMVEDKVDIYSVPGMRTLDVDGLEDQQGQIEDVTTVLGFLTLFVLSFGVGIGSWYFEALRKDALMQKMLDGADFY